MNLTSLETNADQRLSLQKSVIEYAEDFLNSLENRKAYEYDSYEKKDQDSFFDIDEQNHPIEDILPFIAVRVDKPGLNPASGGHLGYIPGGGIYESALGDYLAAVSNRYAGVFYASPGAVRMENALIDWAAKLIGYTGRFGGNLTSGGSIANLIAISTAREAKKLKGKDLESTVIYTSQQTHHSLQKAIKLCGLSECILRIIDLDEDYRIIPEKLNTQVLEDQKQGLQPFLIIANAGSTDVGAVDPLNAIASIAEEHDLWFHVDAAYGGFFQLTAQGKEVMSGIEKADSVILDPHKGLFLPYGSGIVLIKNIEHLAAANSYEANYMQDTKMHQDEMSPAELSPELSKHFRGMRMWLPLKLHGIGPFKACLEEKMELAQYFYTKIKAMGFEVGPAPVLSTVIFRFLPKDKDANEFNAAIVKAIHQDGRIFISSTTLNGQFYMRVAVLSFRTHKKEIDLLLEIIEKQLIEK
ncbi:glutamate/tyrosine decarboxylase-like PLP-dependent enzyme [Roseivirga ehrenbergii]|uniref:Amino acid decarboxylase n=1 Tax=Roseivirga ehrenbergii (strain DSM 102268 / JCM 13514 / KCTC 12282 / NCIMB 14502 / KMM 6017) TaxID=279360 RepID=A0A150X6M2_ROSEK|nr:aminotransferase class V-fold PLP-dependent enzyme [Roseivirga ehrenbergii]KYG74361.1 amino acid decarboxylase [Roseivirga ehrenbergii]TCL14341.1 glutamate/tyrosine decarboxylase-like PLP-dependent enzyme [Roseivirga ehrenbergii]